MKSQLHSDPLPDCVFYDYELRQLRRSFLEIYKTFKNIEKRADRAQTVQISKSLFDYYNRKSDMKACPQKYYDLRNGDVRICLFAYQGRYSVLVSGFKWDSRRERLSDYSGDGILYGSYATPYEAVPLFHEIVFDYVAREGTLINPDNDIPF